MITLVVVFLLGLYVLKIFFPNELAMVIQNEQLIAIGNYIDNNAWAYYTFGIITSFITYWLYLCAVCKKWFLNWKEILMVLLTIGLTIVTNLYEPNLYIAITYSSFVLLPFLFKAEFKPVVIMFCIHLFSQFLTLAIRNFPAYIIDFNSLAIMIATIDCYLWLLLGYFYFNLIKKENN